MFRSSFFLCFGILLVILVTGDATAQVDEICREFGEWPTRETTRTGRAEPYVYGKIVIKASARRPSSRVLSLPTQTRASRRHDFRWESLGITVSSGQV